MSGFPAKSFLSGASHMRATFPLTRWPIGCSLFSSPFPARPRRRRSSTSRTIEQFEQRSLLSASALLVDVPSSLTFAPPGAATSDAAGHAQTANALAALGNHDGAQPLDLGLPAFVGNGTHNDHNDASFAVAGGSLTSSLDFGKPAVSTAIGVQNQPAVTVSVGLQSGLSFSITLTSPSASLSKPSSTITWLITTWVRPQIENTFASLFGSLGSSASRGIGSMQSSLVSSTLASRSFHLLKDAGEPQRAIGSLPQWDSDAEPDQVPAKYFAADVSAPAQTAAKQGQAASTVLKSVASTSTSPSATASLSLAAVESGGAAEANAAFTAPQTANREFLLFDTESFDFFHSNPFARNVTQDQLTAAFATFLSSQQNEERAGRLPAEHAAGARKAAAPESDLVLSGKQGPRDQEEALYWMRGADSFFSGDGSRLLLMPQGRDAEGAKPGETKPGVPGSDGKAAPGAAPQKQNDESGSSSDGSDNPTAKQGSMTWVGLAAAASGGFRALRNRRRNRTIST